MATFQYVRNLNNNRREFVFTEIDNTLYLRFGGLNEDDRLLYESINSGYVGFFQNGQEVAFSNVANRFHPNGIPVDEIPIALALNANYEIRWAQARPGNPGEASDSVRRSQGIIRFSVAATSDKDAEAIVHFDYEVIDAFYRAFEIYFYPDENDYNTRRPIPEDDPMYPRNISISPPLPFATPGEYIHILRYTPTYAGDIYIRIVLVEGEPDQRFTHQLVDINDNLLVDIHNNVLVAAGGPTYQIVDTNNQRLVDTNGNVLIGYRT